MKKTILYDKFLSIESLAYRGKHLVDNESLEKAKIMVVRIAEDLKELKLLLKMPEE